MNAKWVKISLLFFLFVALAGSIMRLTPFIDLPVPFKNILHAHSHVAFQGWVYITLIVLIINLYLDKAIVKKYNLQFSLTVITLIGIMVSFLAQGYAVFSIAFSSLFQFLNYWFTIKFFKDVKNSELAKKHTFSLKFIKVALLLMLLSTIGPWVIGVLSAKGLGGSEYFNAALYFFFHFQYNGWFTFAVLGMFFWWIENQAMPIKPSASKFYTYMLIAVVPAYSLSLLGMSFGKYFQLSGYISAILQLIGTTYFIMFIKQTYPSIKKTFRQIVFILLAISFSCFFIKEFLQSVSSLPVLKQYVFLNKNLIISYIHLVMIGFISFFLLAILFQLNWLKPNKLGIILLILGFIVSEITLIRLGFSSNNLLHHIMVFFSFIMALGIALIAIKQRE